MDKPSYQYVNEIKKDIGDISSLVTTDKTSVVNAVNELFTSVSSGKTVVASAITDKGVITAPDATFAVMAENIRAISGGGGAVDRVKTWDITLSANKTANYVLITDNWLKDHYSDDGLCVLVVPKFHTPAASAASVGSMRTNFSVGSLDADNIWGGYYAYHTANGTSISLTRLRIKLSGATLGNSEYGAISLGSNGALTMRCTSAYPILAGDYKIIGFTFTAQEA